mgnify:FL=1
MNKKGRHTHFLKHYQHFKQFVHRIRVQVYK